MTKKRTKANIIKREKSDLSFVILDKDGKVETELEDGIIKKIPDESNIGKGDNVI